MLLDTKQSRVGMLNSIRNALVTNHGNCKTCDAVYDDISSVMKSIETEQADSADAKGPCEFCISLEFSEVPHFCIHCGRDLHR